MKTTASKGAKNTAQRQMLRKHSARGNTLERALGAEQKKEFVKK